MTRLSRRLKLLFFNLRRWTGFDSQRRNHSGLLSDLWHSPRKLAQSPSAPRLNPSARPSGYSSAARPKTRQPKYSPEEVKRILRGLDKGERAGPVMAQAATLGTLLEERMVRHFRGRERMFDRLTYVVYQYIQGRPCDEIASSVSYFSDGQDVEDAVYFAARLIASQLNRQPAR